MSTEQLTRRIDQILRRLDALEARSQINYTPATTYTPTYLGVTTPGTTTYTTQYGEWVRIGGVVHVWGRIVWTAATGTGNAAISLPFALPNRTDLFAEGSVDLSGVTFANSTPSVFLQTGASQFIMRSPLTNAAPTNVAVEAAGTINFTITYEVV